jgi:hypothetical protein
MDLICRIILSMLFVTPLSLIAIGLNEMTDLPHNYHNEAGQMNVDQIFNDSPTNLVCWNGHVPDGVCRTLYPAYGFKCSENWCAILIPEGHKPDTGLCTSSMSTAPSGYVIDMDNGVCVINPISSYFHTAIICIILLFQIIMIGDIKWITG